MLGLVFGKKSRTEDPIRYTQELKICQYGNADCAADLCRTDCGGQYFEAKPRAAENKLGRAKKQLEDKEGE